MTETLLLEALRKLVRPPQFDRPGRQRCCQCGHAWENHENDHHAPNCAYIIANEALAAHSAAEKAGAEPVADPDDDSQGYIRCPTCDGDGREQSESFEPVEPCGTCCGIGFVPQGYKTDRIYKMHPDTHRLVIRFAVALKDKLRAAELKYGERDSNAWMKSDWEADCRQSLYEHLAKGDPRDVANYCAFMWHHGWSTAPAPPSTPLLRASEVAEVLAWARIVGQQTLVGNAINQHLDEIVQNMANRLNPEHRAAFVKASGGAQ